MIPTIDEDIQYTTGIFSSKKNLLMTPRQLSLIEQSLTVIPFSIAFFFFFFFFFWNNC